MTTIALALFKKFWPYLLAALLVVAAIVWWNRYIGSVEAKGYTHGYDKATAEATAAKLVQLEVNRLAFAKLLSDRDTKAELLTKANDDALKQLGDSQNETAHLRDRLASNSSGLLINATCHQSTPRLGAKAPSVPGVDSGTGARLDKTAERAYNTLRDGIDTVEGKLAACQGELRIRQ